ncbi:Ig-like domain-containing alpha-2-macroglobulin family protein [Enhygromyxa salina]|nr:Ig-like domain-containing alpha-2-macroglobulin family protein [Enhygromyxa salina]
MYGNDVVGRSPAGLGPWILSLLAIFMVSLALGGCTRNKPSEAGEEAAPDPVELDLWAGVPPLDARADDLLGELVPKPGPQKPPQVGEEIELPFPPPAPPSDAVGVSELPEGPLEVLRKGPEGPQSLVEAIRVSFNHPMVPLASIEDLRAEAVPMQIEPEVEGEFRWMGTRTVAFYPSGRLPFSTNYEITIPAGTSSTHGTELGKDVAWTISTPTLALDRSVPYANGATHVGLDQPLLLRFNQPVNASAVAEALTLAAGSKRVALELVPESRWADEDLAPYINQWVTGDDQAWERSRVVVLRPTTRLAPNKKYRVELPAGVYGEGPERGAKISFSFSTYPPLKLSPSRCDPAPCSASYGLTINASNHIRDARIIDKVHVSPEVEDLEINAGYGGIYLSGDFIGDTTYSVTVDAGLEDIYGQELAKPYKAKVRLGPLERSLRVWPQTKHPGIIEAEAGHTLELEVTGLRELEVMASSFNGAELEDYYAYNGGGGYDHAWPADLQAPRHVHKIDVSSSRKQKQTVTLELDDYIDGTDTFVYLMVRSEVYREWNYDQRTSLGQIVQLTKLGVVAAVDRDDAVALVTDLASGEPVPGAEVRVLADRGQREVWKGKSDAAGVARPQLGKRQLGSPLLAVKHGDDEAFMPLDQGELEGRWMSHLFGQSADDEVRAFIFTERQPYKPGETVHLVGIVRKETRGPKGGVVPWGAGFEAKYKVTTPRGVEVQEGTVKLSAFGTFAVDIETDENGDTGNYSFELTHTGLFGNSHRFRHSFAVEAFRTPEFEVEVARNESTPLYFGDELEAEIRGRYLFGAPMVGADVRYTLTRQATDFRPPAEGLSAFHFSSSPGRRYGGWGYFGGNWRPVQQLEAKSKQLDDRGVLKVTHALAQVEPPKPGAVEPRPEPDAEPKPEPPPQAATFSIAATVTDENRQAIAGSGSFVVHPSAYYVGLRSERSVLREDERTRVEAVVVDVEGKRVEGVSVKLRVTRKDTTRTPVQKNGVWTFAYATKQTQTSACDLVSAGAPAACEITVGKAGTHEIIAEIKDAEGRENRSVLEIYVHGKDAVVWDEDNKRVDLVPDKDSYQPGETAKILVRSPFDEARGFLVIEREGRAQTHDLHVVGGMAVVEVEITPEMVAGVTASAVLAKPRTEVAGAPDDQDLGAPAAASGQVALEVSRDQKAVVVEVEPEVDRVEPGDKLRVDIRTHAVDGAPIEAAVAVFVVDEGVLSLMGYQTPDPLAFFHHKRAGEVGLFADHTLVLPRNAAEQPKPVSPEASAVDLPLPLGVVDDGDLSDQLVGSEVGEAYGAGGLGLIGTGRGGGGTGEGTIGLGNTGLIGKGGGGGSGYGLGSGGAPAEAEAEAKPKSRAGGASPPPPAPMATTAMPDPNKAMAQEVSLRTLFATTAYFEAELETDAEGRASVEIDMPENLTSFRIMAVAVDPKVYDRFGSGESSVRVRKAVMLRPSLPRFLNMGDEFEASVMVDNQTETHQAVMVGTRGVNVKLLGEVETTIEIPAGESREVRFPMAVDEVGVMRLQFAALSNEGRDATQLDLPVLVPATKQAFADYGMTSASVQRAVQLPKDALPGFGGLEVSMSSTALNGLEDAVEFLVTYPYECSEQTASRLLPIFALGDVLDDFPIADVHDRARRDALAKDGIERLLQRQNWDGGFTYWGDDTRRESWPYLSTWVTLALVEGKAAGFEVDQAKLDQAMAYLDNYVRNGISTRWGAYYDWTTRAFALWLLSREGRGADQFDKVWAKRAQIPLYGRVLLMSAAHRYKREGPVAAVLEELNDQVVENARVIHFAESRTEAGAADGLAVLMHSNTQTDAIALMALMEIGEETGDDGMAAKIMAGLMSDRDPRMGGRWTSTHANAWALLAVSRYYEVIEAETPDFSARIWLDDMFAAEQKFVGRDMAKVNQHVPMRALLGESVQSVTLAKDGPGKLYYRLGLRYAPADFHMDPVDRGFTVSRRYEALPEGGEDEADPDAVRQLDDGSWSVKAGTNVKVTLTLVVQDRASFVVVDDPLPAGFEGQNPRFLTSVAVTNQGSLDYGYGLGGGYGRGGYDYNYGRGGSYGWWYPWYSFDHTQMRDDRMLLFADWLAAGVYTYSYTARATNIGTFVLPPVHAEAMYEPERFGHGSSSVVKIIE